MEKPRSSTTAASSVTLPRVAIQFCTQCKWMLRAAYFAQELLSTFSTSLGEVALIPSTGGIFTVDITHSLEAGGGFAAATVLTRLWDRKEKGGFPEIKVLKQLVRDIIDPKRDLGHADRDHNKEEKQDDPAISTQVQNVAVADNISDPTTVEADPGNSGFHPKKTHNEDKVNTASCKDCR